MKKVICNIIRTLKTLSPLSPAGSLLAASLMLSSPTTARGFVFNESDMLVGFRQPGGSYELVVNLGPATNFNTFARQSPGGSIAITNYTVEKLGEAFSDLGGVDWSVFSSVVTVGYVDPPYATCWLTRPRTDISIKTESWVRWRPNSQTAVCGVVYGVGTGATLVTGQSSDTQVIIDAGSAIGYAARVGDLGDFGGRWQGVVEASTPSDFVTSELTSRLDLYYVIPDQANKKLPGQYLGFFDFKWDGTLSFTAALATPTLNTLSPREGDSLGGTQVTLTGSDFASGLTVKFDGSVSPQVTFVSTSEIKVVTPAHSAGPVDVVIANPDGQSAKRVQGFTYVESNTPQTISIVQTSLAGLDLTLLSVGATNGTTWLLTSTDLRKPLADWTPIFTNRVGADGRFTNAVPVDPTEATRFYNLTIP